MNKLFEFVILLVMCVFILAGCAGQPTQEKVVESTKIELLAIPEQYLTTCNITKPISSDDYSKLLIDDQNTYFASFAKALLKDLKLCNAQIKGLVSWYNEQNKIYYPASQ